MAQLLRCLAADPRPGFNFACGGRFFNGSDLLAGRVLCAIDGTLNNKRRSKYSNPPLQRAS